MQNFKNQNLIFTIGHSIRKMKEFIEILKKHKIQVVIDIRRFPKSKIVPHFNKENLKTELRKIGIKYAWLGKWLGGYRKEGYLKYMEKAEFKKGIKYLENIAKNKICVIMCAEKLYFKCHRKFVSKYLQNKGWIVKHIKD